MTVYNTSTYKIEQAIECHSHYVQGVSWDPLDFYIASTSCDRTVKIHSSIKKGCKITRNGKNSNGNLFSSKFANISKRDFVIENTTSGKLFITRVFYFCFSYI